MRSHIQTINDSCHQDHGHGQGWTSEQIFWQLAVEDIHEAAELFQPLYRESKGQDGYVSLEVNPLLANNTKETIEQAQILWNRVDMPNLMIKIPATREGVPAIREAIAAGLNINVTLIFSLERYLEVIDAYLTGLEDRVSLGNPSIRLPPWHPFLSRGLTQRWTGNLPNS